MSAATNSTAGAHAVKALRGAALSFDADPFAVPSGDALRHISDALVVLRDGRVHIVGFGIASSEIQVSVGSGRIVFNLARQEVFGIREGRRLRYGREEDSKAAGVSEEVVAGKLACRVGASGNAISDSGLVG